MAINLVSNPSFEVDTSGWSGAALASVVNPGAVITGRSGTAAVGSYALQVAADATYPYEGVWTTVPVTAGQQYTVSAYINGQAGTPNMALIVRDNATTPASAQVQSPSDGTYRRASASLTTGAGATTLTVGVATTTALAKTFLVDGVMVETGSTLSPYVDAMNADALTVAIRPYDCVGIDVAWQGVSPWLTRIVRSDGPVVLGADPLYTPAGAGYAQDNFPPLGKTITYTAYGYDGINPGVIARSKPVTITTPTLSSGRALGSRSAGAAWIKAVRDPSLSLIVVGVDFDEGQKRPMDVYEPLGREFPIIHDDVLQSRRGTLTVVTLTKADGALMRKLLRVSPVVLFQPEAGLDVADMWAFLGDVKPTPASARNRNAMLWPLPYIEVGPPATRNSPVYVPGWSYDIRDTQSATYDAADARFPTYRALTKGL